MMRAMNRWRGVAAAIPVLLLAAGAAAQPEASEELQFAGDIDLAPTGYEERVTAAVFNNFDNINVTIRGGFGRSRVADDFRFDPGPWSLVRGTTTRIGYAVGQQAFSSGSTVRVRIEFYPTMALTQCIDAGSQPFATYTSGPLALPSNPQSGGVFYRIRDAFVATFQDSEGAYVQSLLDANGVPFPEPIPATAPNNVILNGHTVGSTNRFLYRDANADGRICPNGSDERAGTGTPLWEGLILRLSADLSADPCDADYTFDGNVDQDDIRLLIGLIAGEPNPRGIDPDFNRDGDTNQNDVDALLNVIAGGPCP